MKKILTVQDFSCVGKCSLTVAMPIISAFGIETCALPTALLSTHTQFKNWTFANLCEEINPITQAWEKENIKFDGVYTGYLGAVDLIDKVKNIIEKFTQTGGLVMIDPAMGDGGKLYANFDMDYVKATKSLCSKADIITPNITEAAFMLDMEYKSQYDRKYFTEICKKLHENGAENVILTGIRKNEDEIGAFCLFNGTEIYEYYNKRENTDFHGTGDIYSSAVYGALMKGKSLPDAVKFACDYTKHCIAVTLAEPNHSVYGVNFEECTPDIVEFINQK